MGQDDARVLVVTDAASDAEVVRRMLADEYPQTSVSTDPHNLVADFERLSPQVLLFAFRKLGDSWQHYLNLCASCKRANELPHMSLVLCHRDDVRDAVELCRSDCFDDPVPFWPSASDARQLPASVRRALRVRNGQIAIGSMAQVTAQARRMAALKAQREPAAQTGRTMTQAPDAVGGVLDRLAEIVGSDAGDDAETGGAMIKRVRAAMANLDSGSASAVPRYAEPDMAHRQASEQKPDAAAPALSAAAHVAGAHSARRRPRIMVVDDDDIMRKLLSKVLSAQDYDVDAVSNGFAALQSLQSALPDLILMDVQMPKMDGIQLTRRLKQIEAYAGIPVLMLTGRSEHQLIVDSRAAGATDVILKPFEREILLQKLQRYVAQERPVDSAA